MRVQADPPARAAAVCCPRLLLLLLLLSLSGARAQVSPTSTPGAAGCVARYIRIDNTPGVANQTFYASLRMPAPLALS